jgi:hypothetical protein
MCCTTRDWGYNMPFCDMFISEGGILRTTISSIKRNDPPWQEAECPGEIYSMQWYVCSQTTKTTYIDSRDLRQHCSWMAKVASQCFTNALHVPE